MTTRSMGKRSSEQGSEVKQEENYESFQEDIRRVESVPKRRKLPKIEVKIDPDDLAIPKEDHRAIKKDQKENNQKD